MIDSSCDFSLWLDFIERSFLKKRVYRFNRERCYKWSYKGYPYLLIWPKGLFPTFFQVLLRRPNFNFKIWKRAAKEVPKKEGRLIGKAFFGQLGRNYSTHVGRPYSAFKGRKEFSIGLEGGQV